MTYIPYFNFKCAAKAALAASSSIGSSIGSQIGAACGAAGARQVASYIIPVAVPSINPIYGLSACSANLARMVAIEHAGVEGFKYGAMAGGAVGAAAGFAVGYAGVKLTEAGVSYIASKYNEYGERLEGEQSQTGFESLDLDDAMLTLTDVEDDYVLVNKKSIVPVKQNDICIESLVSVPSSQKRISI